MHRKSDLSVGHVATVHSYLRTAVRDRETLSYGRLVASVVFVVGHLGKTRRPSRTTADFFRRVDYCRHRLVDRSQT